MARMLGAGLAQLPAALAIAAVAVAAIGLLPGAEAAVGWTALGLTVVIGMFGPSLQLPHWLLDVSPFTHVLRLPGGKVSAAPLAWLSLAALTLTVAGLAGLRHRDIG
jgi:ABC-2 type transport system permease protein